MNLLERIIRDTGYRYTRVSMNSRGDGPEYAGPCPFCAAAGNAGTDRLHIWPDAARPHCWCRAEDTQRDEIQYLRDRGMRYREALVELGRNITFGPDPSEALTPLPPEPCDPPPNEWQNHYNVLVLRWMDQLWSEAYTRPLEYLHQRGFDDETLIRAGIGYNPTASKDEAWGWIPRGIVIPAYIGADLWEVKIRRPETDQYGKYINLRGSSNPLYNADALRPGRPACLVEGYFDALAVVQQAGDLVTAIAAGSTSGARHMRWYLALQRCSSVLQAFDDDEPGDTGAAHWLALFGQKVARWRPYLHDPAEMLKNGLNIRGWIELGLAELQRQAA